jgi:hypothetical protein
MRCIIFFCFVLGLSVPISGVEIKHAVATVEVHGEWEKDKESGDDTLILNSKPEGHQIVVSILNLWKEAADLDQIVDTSKKIFALRLSAAQKLSPDVKFENPEVSNTDSSILCICRGFAPKEKVRIAIRIEGSSKTVRSTSIYDYTGQSAEVFQRWSTEVLAGVKPVQSP